MESLVHEIQLASALGVAALYFILSLLRDHGRKMDAKRLSQIIAASTSALILPFGAVLAYSAYNPAALNWLKEGYRLSFLIVGIGAIAHALINLKDNLPK